MTTLVPPQLLNPSGSTAGQVLRSTGPSSIPGWAALVSGDLPTIPVTKGGTGQTSASGAALDAIAGFSFTGYMKRTGAGSYTSVATIPITEGGTGATSAGAALTNLGALAASAIPSAWTSYTPTITALTGTFTTASATGSYYKIGNLVFFRVKITITTVGTGTNPIFTLPFQANASGDRVILAGSETALTGKMLQARVDNSATTSTVFVYDNTSPAATGAVCMISGCYLSV
jgi:hypothetical protein